MAADRRPVVVLAALRGEAQDLARHLVRARIEGPGVRSWEGTLAGKPVVLVLTRVGKVAAAMAASSPATCTGRTLWCRSASPAPPTWSARGRLIVASGASSTTWTQGRSPMREA